MEYHLGKKVGQAFEPDMRKSQARKPDLQRWKREHQSDDLLPREGGGGRLGRLTRFLAHPGNARADRNLRDKEFRLTSPRPPFILTEAIRLTQPCPCRSL